MSDSIEAPPSWLAALEVRAVGELALLELAKPLRPLLPRGDGHHVVVLPGFTADDRSTQPLRRLLGELGYHAHGWGLGENLGPTTDILRGIRQLLDRVHAGGAPVSIIGWSLGGIFARELARASPAMVRQVITLGSPIQMIEADRSSASTRYESLRHLHDPSRPRRQVRAAFLPPLEVPTTSVYSRTDGVVRWQASLIRRSDRSENIRVVGSHCGLGFNLSVVYAIADRLAQHPDRWRPFAPPLVVRAWYPPADDLDPSRLP